MKLSKEKTMSSLRLINDMMLAYNSCVDEVKIFMTENEFKKYMEVSDILLDIVDHHIYNKNTKKRPISYRYKTLKELINEFNSDIRIKGYLGEGFFVQIDEFDLSGHKLGSKVYEDLCFMSEEMRNIFIKEID